MSDEAFTRAPCGCAFGNVGHNFVIQPCSPTCKTYAYAITESRKKGIEYREIQTDQLARDMFSHDGFLDNSIACPFCGGVSDSFSGEAERPTADARVVCFYCARIGVFTEDGKVRKPTDEEAAEDANHFELQTMRRLIQRSIRERLMEK